jgi:hypothetical protein
VLSAAERVHIGARTFAAGTFPLEVVDDTCVCSYPFVGGAVKAIQTSYKGYRFRSRLEARWAVFFDALGIKWEYEPEGFELGFGERYLPDFFTVMCRPGGHLLSYKKPGYWVEIKGCAPTADELRKLQTLSNSTGHHAYLFWGMPGEHQHFRASIGGAFPLEADYSDLTFAHNAAVSCCSPFLGAGWLDKVDAGVYAARGARFEFGEEG